MATAIDNYVFDIRTRGLNELKRAKEELKDVGDAAQNTGEHLRNMGIAGAAGLAALFASVISLTDEVSDLSDATGISMGKIRGLGASLELAGGKADDAGKMLNKFSVQIDDAAQGSDKARKALRDVGISLSDLRSKSEEQLFDQAIKKLSEMEAGSKRTALGIELFGKSFGTVDPKALNAALATGDFKELQRTMEENKKVVDALKQTFLNFQQALMNVIRDAIPYLEKFVGPIDDMVISVQQAEKMIKAFGIALGLVIGAQVLMAFKDLVTITIALAKAARLAAIAQAGLAIATANPAKVAAGVAALAAMGVAYSMLSDNADEAAKSIENTRGVTGTVDSTKVFTGREVVGATDKEKAEADARRKRIHDIEKISKSFVDQNQSIRDGINLQGQMVGMTEVQRDVLTQSEDVRRRQSDQIANIDDQIANLSDKEKSLIPVLNAQRDAINANADATVAGLERQIPLLHAKIQAEQVSKQLKDLETQHGSTMLKLDQDRATVMTRFTGMNATQEKFAREELRIKNDLLLKLRAINDEYAKNVAGGMTPENAGQIKNTKTDQANAEADAQIEIAKSVADEQTRIDASYAEGFRSKMEQMSQSFTPFQMAADATTMAMGHIGSSIDQMVETGKASFSDLARSIIKDITKMILKQMIFNAISGMVPSGKPAGLPAGFGDMGSLGKTNYSIGAQAKGGTINGNKPYVVGERGPELFIPGGNGTIVPNRNLGGEDKPAVTNIQTFNVSAIDGQSVAKFFMDNKQLVMMSNMQAQKERR